MTTSDITSPSRMLLFAPLFAYAVHGYPARVYREVEEGRRDSQEGLRLIYMLSQITKILELTEIERRLTVFEDRNR